MQIEPVHLARVQALIAQGERRLLGLAGPPGAGKSSVAQALLAAFPQHIQVLPMDGFHLAGAELERLGRAQRKGAEDTFDSAGYLALLCRIKTQPAGETIYAPDFRRDLEEPIAGAIAVQPHTPLIVTEGNYLLLETGHWAKLRALLDEVWYIDVDDDLRRDRLMRRHMQFGRSSEEAREWVAHTDEPNAKSIAATMHRADVILRPD